MANTIRIKRRVASGSAGAPTSLKNGELAYNENDNRLYYGFGDDGSGNATTIPAIAGSGLLDTDYVDIASADTITGAKTFTATSNFATIASGLWNGTPIADAYLSTNTAHLSGAQTFTGVKSFTPVVNANGGISTTSGNLVLDSTGGTIDINDNVDISGTLVVGSTLNGHTIPGGTGTFALTTDALATTSGHNYITLSGQDIVQGDVALGTHTSGNYVGTLSAAAGNPGITVAGSAGEGTSATVAVDSTVIRTTGVQNIGGIKTFTSLVNANAGIAVDTNKFTVADVTGNTVIAGTLNVAGLLSAEGDLGVTGDIETFGTLDVTGVTTLAALVNANGGIAVDTNKFTVADVTGNTLIAGTLGVTGATSLGTVSAGTWAATDVAVAHGGTGASTAAAARTNLGVDVGGTDNSTNVTLAGSLDYLTISGQVITRGAIDLAADVSGILPAAKVGVLAASKITSGTLASARLPEATSTAKGAIELFSNTDQSVAATAVSSTAARTYGIQLNASGQAVVNIPWTDTQATRATLGLATTDNVTFASITTSADIEVGTSLDVIGDAEVQGTTTLTTAAATVDTDKFLVSDGGVVKYRTGAQVRSDIGVTRDFLGIDTDDTVTFGNIVSAGYLRGPAVFTIDPAAHGDDTGKVVIAGDLQVDGTTTTVNSTVISIGDKNLTLGDTATTSATLNGAGLHLGTDPNSPPTLVSGALVEFAYVHTDTRMVLSSAMKITGGLEDTVIDGGTF